MSSAIRQADLRRRQRAAFGVGGVFFFAAATFLLWALARSDLALAGVLVVVCACIGVLLWVARRGHVRVAGYALSLCAFAGVVGGAVAHGSPGYASFFMIVGVAIGSVALAPRDVVVVFALGLIGEAIVAALPKTPGIEPLANVVAEGTLLTVIVGVVVFAMTWSVTTLLDELVKRDADVHAADDRANSLALQLEQSQRMEALGRLAGGVAHDFNNLLTVIQSSVALLEERLPGDDGDAHVELKELELAVDRGAALTRQLLAFSRRDVVQMNLVDVAATTHTLGELLQRLLGSGVRVSVTVPPKPCSVLASTSQIEQILMNLAVNARDAMSGKGELFITVEGAVDDAIGPACRVIVRDTGPGMSDAVKARAFEPFFTTKPAGKGTGLGLATVYGIATGLGGHVRIDSTPGQGATFIVTLPHAAAAPKSQTPDGARAPRVVAVVDDEPRLREHMTRALALEGLQVRAFASAAALLDDRTAPAIDVLVTDVHLRDESGVALAHEMLRRQPDLRVVLVSGYTADPSSTSTLLERGARFVAKPFAAGELVAAVFGRPPPSRAARPPLSAAAP